MTGPAIPASLCPAVSPAAFGMALFSANDAIGKWLVDACSVGQGLLIRSLVALRLITSALWRLGPSRLVRLERPALQALRVAFSTGERVGLGRWAATAAGFAGVLIAPEPFGGAVIVCAGLAVYLGKRARGET